MQIDFVKLWATYQPLILSGAFNVLAASLILVVGLSLANWAGRAVRRVSRRHPRIDDTLAAFFSWIVRYALTGFVIVAVLHRFGVETTSIVAVLGAATLAIGLALQGTLSNLAAGVMLILFRPYRLGDYVELDTKSGTVRDVNLFTTELVTPNNLKIVLPNSLCWGSPIVNYTAHRTRRLDLRFTVAYDTDLDHALAVIENVIEAEARVLADPAPNVRVEALGDFAIVLLARIWCATPDAVELNYAIKKAAKEALDAHGVVIPFPTSTNYEVRLPPPAPPPVKLKPRNLDGARHHGGEEPTGD